MKDIFPGHYRPAAREIESMWAEGTFVFDTNALLNLYRYTDDTRETFIQTLEALGDRVWIPYQVGFEFFEKRAQVMSTAVLAYEKLCGELDKAKSELEKVLNGFRRHPGIDVEDISQSLGEMFSKLKSELKSKEAKHPDWLNEHDPVLARLTDIFSGKVGERPTPDEYNKLVEAAKRRFENSNPPGLRDKDKGGVAQYGDAILWLEILNMASRAKSAVIFITDDVKDDWWQRVGGKTIGPLPELRQELWDAAQVPLHMYQCDQFLKYASKFLDRKLPESSIEEAKEVRNEMQRIASELKKWWKADPEKLDYPVGFHNFQIKDAYFQYDLDADEQRPALVSDYRGPTLAIQVKNLVDQRNKLSKLYLELPPEDRASENGQEIRKAISFIDREINLKTGYISKDSEMWNIVFGPNKDSGKD
ncbi:PIN domain-containing protein [Burkholderia orbicola]|uniref:PIN domain-containing protein n=1 Tax=Burkholderia orbicola TaxID=2978683 RepID=UPI002654B461|nr:PIN domain-containing protein [Burkholderia orbicola]MDN7466985.1 PIN domain-containing protein [Burkholderia orbicola]